MLDKIFGWGRKAEQPEPTVTFGRYSDNNKPVAKVDNWTQAEEKFRTGKYNEALDLFFAYLRDDETQNVTYTRDGDSGRFELFQGSKIVKGQFKPDRVEAEVTLAKMPQPSVPVMRRLLEMNFTLYYGKFALDGDRLCMRFDSELKSAPPSKLYYGLKELATRADKQDDLLVLDFSSLQKTDHEHITELSAQEKEVKYGHLVKWITDTIELCNSLDPGKFSGGMSYVILSLIFRIDYLICPEARLLSEFEKIIAIYYKNDERQVMDKNRDMLAGLQKILEKPKEEILQDLFRSKYTFSIVAPQTYKAVIDSIQSSLQNMPWYRDNNYPHIANQVIEYGLSFCQYSYSLPRVVTELFHLYMMINYSSYFTALGFTEDLYDDEADRFQSRAIITRVENILDKWKEKYPALQFRSAALRFDTLVNFNHSFALELSNLNIEG